MHDKKILRADDSDLLKMLWDPMSQARNRIRAEVLELGLEATSDEITKFAIILIALAEDGAT
jgi:hypothetical protein